MELPIHDIQPLPRPPRGEGAEVLRTFYLFDIFLLKKRSERIFIL